MTIGQKWIRRPQKVWLRKAVFQAHLWTGIGLGLYVLLMSISGSAIIFRRQLSKKFSSPRTPNVGLGNAMSPGDLKLVAIQAYPDYEVLQIVARERPDRPVEIRMVRGSKRIQRLFNPYTGADMGDPLQVGFRALEWFVDLHDNLLFERTGRMLNGIGGILTTLLCMTGFVIWWPGIDRWRLSLTVNWKANPKSFNWALHSAIGFWCFAFVFMWGLSGIYLSMPGPFNNVVDFFEPMGRITKNSRDGDTFLFWLARLHFGRFAGLPLEICWTIIGLMPVVLFVTGSVMWWNRVLRPWRLRTRVHQPPPPAVSLLDAE